MSAETQTWDVGVRQAHLVAQVRNEVLASLGEVEGWLADLGRDAGEQKQRIVNHRLNALLTSVSWHAARQTDAQRLESLDAELRRLRIRAGADTPEGKLYTLLAARISLGHPTGEVEDRLLRGNPPPQSERERWRLQARLLFAQALIGLCAALVRCGPLLDQLNQKGRLNEWP